MEYRCQGCGKMYRHYTKIHHHREECPAFLRWHENQNQRTARFLELKKEEAASGNPPH